MTQLQGYDHGALLTQSDPYITLSNRTRRILIASFAGVLMSLVLYAMTGDIKIAAMGIGITALVAGMLDPGIAFFVLFSVISVETMISPSSIFSISKVVGILVLASFTVHTQWRDLKITAPLWYFIALFILSICSIVWAVSPINAALGVSTLILILGLIVMLSSYIRGINQLDILMYALVVSSMIGSLALIFFGQNFFAGGGGEEVGRMSLGGRDDSPVHLANKIMLGYIAAIYLFQRNRGLLRWMILATAPISAYAILLTQTRLTLAALFLVPFFAFMLGLDRRRAGRYVVLGLAIATAGVACYFALAYLPILPEAARDRMIESVGFAQNSGRLQIWINGLSLFFSNIFTGVGVNNFDIAVEAYSNVKSAHNNYVSIAGELGIVGISLFITMLISLLVRGRSIQYAPLRWLCLAMLSFACLCGMTSETWDNKYFWYCIGFAIVGWQVAQGAYESLYQRQQQYSSAQ
jgi:O-antigen ligase